MVVSGTWDSYNAADVRIPQRVDSKTHPLLISLMLKGGTREIILISEEELSEPVRIFQKNYNRQKNVQGFRFRECNPGNLKSKFPPFFQQISSISKAPPLSLPRGGRWEHRNDPHKEGCAMQLTNSSQNAAVQGKGCPT